MRTWIASLALVVPVVAMTLGLTAITLAERTGHQLFAFDAAHNSAEAAAFGDAAAVVRFLEAGEDPLAVHPIRADAISSTVRLVTTPEAAVLARRPEMLLLLEQWGAFRDPAVRTAVACLAGDVGQTGSVSFLWPSAAPACEPGAAVERMLARSRATDAGRGN